MNLKCLRVFASLLTALTLAIGAPGSLLAMPHDSDDSQTTTPIKHLVVIFQENVSFDHYFGTYPTATNPGGEPKFFAAPGTPTVNGLSGGLLTTNPNLLAAGNGAFASNPFRLDRTQAVTTDQDHNYPDEQAAFDSGLMDLFPSKVGKGGIPAGSTKSLTMGYYDGNTVTAIWNYAQHFSMSDNFYGTTFGPSTPGLLNLVSGQTNGIAADNGLGNTGFVTTGGGGSLTLIGDADPLNDVCSSSTRYQAQMKGMNIGDLLTSAGVTWGSFMGGFDLTVKNPNGTTGCARSSAGLAGTTGDYIPHHGFFQYHASTANPKHTRPASIAEIGNNGPANHNYDLRDFYAAVIHGNLPAVSFIKASAYQDGHAGYSDPLDEQTFIVNLINFLQLSPEWKETAVVITYDDSDGWYDHQMGPILNQSTSPADLLTGPGACGNGNTALPGPAGIGHAQGRCGYGPRFPLLVISPWAKRNFVDNTVTDLTSIIRFAEDNWLGGKRIDTGSYDALANSIDQMFDFSNDANHVDRLILDPGTGLVISDGHDHDGGHDYDGR